MEVKSDLLYTEEHEWIKVEGNIATVGITDYAQSELGDIVFIELPSEGDETQKMEPFGTIEAVKAVSDLYAPLAGKITEVNTKLEETPELINQYPYNDGWMVKIELSDASELDSLLSPDAYKDKIS